MNSSILQKATELTYGNFFIQWLNNAFGWEFEAKANSEENSEIDIYALSVNDKPNLNFQMVTSNGETMRLAAETKQKINKGQDIELIAVQPIEWISKVIEEKDKKYPLSLKENLILIIQGFMPIPTPEEIKISFKTYSSLSFKGIYYVSLPAVSSTHKDYEDNGYVIAIKELVQPQNI